jgi:hypothetical protein
MGDYGTGFRNADHEHMRRSRPEIVLDEQCAIRACCRCHQARMLEFQRHRFVDALHERRDEAPICLDDPISLGALDFFDRYFALERLSFLCRSIMRMWRRPPDAGRPDVIEAIVSPLIMSLIIAGRAFTSRSNRYRYSSCNAHASFEPPANSASGASIAFSASSRIATSRRAAGI